MAKGKYAQRRARRKRHGVSDQGQARRYLRVRESLPSRDPKPQPYLARPEERGFGDERVESHPRVFIVLALLTVAGLLVSGAFIALRMFHAR